MPDNGNDNVVETPEGGAVVTVNPTQEQSVKVADTSEIDNLVPSIKTGKARKSLDGTSDVSGKEFLRQLGEDCVLGYEADEGSRAEWREHKATELKLFMSFLPKKS
ncbi:hypothetical protein LCGC14_2683390, partial [marine sediment metagenome]